MTARPEAPEAPETREVPEAPEPGPPTMRERYRAQVRQEVKQAALSQLAESGPAGVSVSAIGKELGVSGPALYRYFASRDQLLTELVLDAYDDLAQALRTAANTRPQEGWKVLARAYRSWALAEPHRYQLLYEPPLPGYDAHAQRLVDAAQVVMNLFLDSLRDLEDSTPKLPKLPNPPGPLAFQLPAWAQRRGVDVDPAIALRAVLIWTALHGLVSLEIAGNFASMGIDPAQLFDIQLANLSP